MSYALQWFDSTEFYVDGCLMEIDYLASLSGMLLEIITVYRTTERPGWVIHSEVIENESQM